MEYSKVTSFTDLIAWQKAHALILSVYSSTKDFPKEELFVLTSQLRRCAISITSNIAEGFSRKGKNEKIQFYSVALGSLTELQNQLYIARDLHYIENPALQEQMDLSVEVHKLLNALVKTAQNRP